MELPDYVTPAKDGAYVDVFVQPGAAKNALVGVHGPALKLKVTAPPVQGRANEAAERMIAEMLDLPTRLVRVVKGGASRHKRLAVSGMDPEEVACELIRVLSSRSHDTG